MNTHMLFVGIDPGVHGGIAAIDSYGSVKLAKHFPTVSVCKSTKGKKTEFDFGGIRDLFDEVSVIGGFKRAWLESVNSMPTDSRQSAFTFGGSFWALRMALADREIPYEMVRPRLWQEELLKGIAHSSSKMLRDAYLAKARTMFPAVDLSKKKDAEIAAALLIAEFGRRQFVATANND